MAPRSDKPRREHPGPPRDTGEIQPQELVVTLFGAYARNAEVPAWSGGLVEILTGFGFTPGAARVALNRVVERGLLDRDREGRFISYFPTARLQELVDVGDRRLAELSDPPPWDGNWTVVWYSIPESLRRERHRLGRRLRFLGFGPLEDSTWVAAGDKRAELVPYLERLGVRELAGVFVGKHVVPPDAIASRAWACQELVLRYELFVKEFSRLVDRKLSDANAFTERTRLINTFRRFPYIDPGLPQGFFPAAESRAAAVELFQRLYPSLEVQAQHHFDSLTRRVGEPA